MSSKKDKRLWLDTDPDPHEFEKLAAGIISHSLRRFFAANKEAAEVLRSRPLSERQAIVYRLTASCTPHFREIAEALLEQKLRVLDDRLIEGRYLN